MSQGRRRSPLPQDWPRRRRRVLRRDQHACQLQYADRCTIQATEVDHINGHDNHDLTNLQAVCHDCHAHKTGKDAQAARIYPKRQRPPEQHPGLSHP